MGAIKGQSWEVSAIRLFVGLYACLGLLVIVSDSMDGYRDCIVGGCLGTTAESGSLAQLVSHIYMLNVIFSPIFYISSSIDS